MSVIPSEYATSDPAADPRPGPTGMSIFLAASTKSQTMSIYPGNFIEFMISISTLSLSLYSWCLSSGTIFRRFSSPRFDSSSKSTISFSSEYSTSGNGISMLDSFARSLANLKLGGVGSPSFISTLHLSAISCVASSASGISANNAAICSGDFT